MRISALALVACLVCVGAIADRVPEPPHPSRAALARKALRTARQAEQDAITACVAYALSSDAPTDRTALEACAELLRTGAVPDDIQPVPAYRADRPGITL